MVLVDLYSGPNYIFETITGHSEGTSRALALVLYLALAEEARADATHPRHPRALRAGIHHGERFGQANR